MIGSVVFPSCNRAKPILRSPKPVRSMVSLNLDSVMCKLSCVAFENEVQKAPSFHQVSSLNFFEESTYDEESNAPVMKIASMPEPLSRARNPHIQDKTFQKIDEENNTESGPKTHASTPKYLKSRSLGISHSDAKPNEKWREYPDPAVVDSDSIETETTIKIPVEHISGVTSPFSVHSLSQSKK